MKECPWEEINDFRSLNEFERFESWIKDQADGGNATEVPVEASYRGFASLRETWFRHEKSGTVWRLVQPDFPFTGLFEQVTELVQQRLR